MWILGRKNTKKVRPEAPRLFAVTYEDYVRMLEDLADALPWFGEPPLTPAGDRYVPRPAGGDDRFVRRVLLSWLVGRPVSQVAKRAGCSPRLVLNIVREAVYRPVLSASEEFEYWCRLGLLAPVDGPEFVGDERFLEPWVDIDLTCLPVVCLACHRLVGIAEASRRRFDGARLTLDDRRFEDMYMIEGLNRAGSFHDMQAHVIMHFQLGFDSIPVASSRRLNLGEEFGLMFGTLSRSQARSVRARHSLRNRLRWEDAIPPETLSYLYSHMEDGGYEIAPRRGRNTLGEEQATRHWKRLLRQGD